METSPDQAGAQATRDAALARLEAARDALRMAQDEHEAASNVWMSVTCRHHQRGTGWCTEAPGHDGDHQNLRGARWPAGA